jgi:energy-coupling factor transporter ATP-binding protein EcfA2
MDLDLSVAPGSPRKITIILGVNGAGKTTILDSIVHTIGEVAAEPDLGARTLGPSDVRNDDDSTTANHNGTRIGEVVVDFILSEDELKALHRRPKNVRASGTVRCTIGSEEEDIGDDSMDDIPSHTISFPEIARSVMRDSQHGFCAYLPTDRGILEFDDSVQLKDVIHFNNRSNCLSRERMRFAPLAATLAIAGFSTRSGIEPSVRRMWKVLEKYFPEMPRPIEPRGSMLHFRNHRGAIVPLTSLSDGERAILLIFADLALRNPQNNVVLIDELEQHLHPRWQRQMLYGLSSLLPNAQFIITTQSPYLAACAPDDVIKLPEWDTHGE